LLLALLGRGLRSHADISQLNLARTNANVVLTWTSPGVALESAPAPTGAWSVVTGAVSPRVIAPTNLASFYHPHSNNLPHCSVAVRPWRRGVASSPCNEGTAANSASDSIAGNEVPA